MAAIPVGGHRFGIGRVVERTVAVLSRNFVGFYVMTFLLASAPNAVINWLARARAVGGLDPVNLLLTVVVALVGVVTALLVQGALVWATVADLNGRKASLAELFEHGLSRILPILGVGIVMALGIGVGLIFLIVPGVILYLMWSVAISVTVVERPPFLQALSRSAALTRGSRWAIFGLLVILLVISSVVGGVGGAIGGAITGVNSPLFYVVLALINTFAGMLNAVGGAVLYVELRAAKEGIQPDALASVFD